MDNVESQNNHPKKSALRQYVFVLAFVVCGLALMFYGSPFFAVTYRAHTLTAKNDTKQIATSTFKRSAPSRIIIPSLNIDTTFETPLKLNADKTVAVPTSYDKVGWYEGGATPGEIGPAVILGHVDSYQGPAVFYSLGQLKKGDNIAITREDGTTATFEVQTLERYERKDFPTELVYGQTDQSVLRLVTCSGIFNKGIQEYSHNLVVYATLKK